MNKFVIIAGIIVAIILLGGFGVYKLSSNKAPTPTPQTVKSNPIANIFGKSVSVQCAFDDAGRHTVAYIKNGTVRADSTNAQDTAQDESVIMKDNKMYVWTVSTKKGFVFDMTTLTTTPVPPGQMSPDHMTTQENQASSFKATVEKYKEDCKNADISDALFTPPADVTFSSISTMIPTGMPTGMKMPTGVPTEYQQYMQNKMPPAQQ